MSLFVVVERHAIPGCQETLESYIREICQKTGEQKHCLSIRGWKSIQSDRLLGAQGGWRSYDDWLEWISSDAFKGVNEEMRLHQTEPEVITVYRDYTFYSGEVSDPGSDVGK